MTEYLVLHFDNLHGDGVAIGVTKLEGACSIPGRVM